MTVQDIGSLRASVELDDQKFERKYRGVDRMLDDLESRPDPKVAIDADPTKAQRAFKVVDDAGEELAKREYDPQIDAEITKAQDKIDRLGRELDILRRTEVTPTVKASIGRAERALQSAESRLKALDGIKAEMEVRADTSGAEAALDDVVQDATDAGDRAGAGAGGNLAAGIIAAIATIPVAGAIVGIGAAIGDALMSGLDNEVREDLFSARTGLDAATAARFGRAAGEAYANNWGDSIAANLDTARRAVEAGLLDPDATARDAQAVVEQISAVSGLLEEDIPRVTRAAATAIKTGMATDAASAFDLLVRGQQASLNVSEDLLDTVNEYSTLFRALGLEGPQAFGLMSQAVAAGARDTDKAADALKEFQIRATDASELSAEGFMALGLDAREMTAQIARGGDEAAAGLDVVLDRLRTMEDPVARNAAAVALFGTQAEDLGAALFAMDLSNAVEQLGAVEGAAQSAMDTLGDNTQATLDTAQRNIETAADGVKGALATAFGPQIEGFATFVTENREAVLTFLLDAANGALNFARSMVEGTASMAEGLGDFIAGPAADLIDALANIAYAVDNATPGDQGALAFREWADSAIEGMQGARDDMHGFADDLRTNLIDNALDPAQDRLNEIGIPLVAQAALHDAAVALAGDIDGLGYAADGTQQSIELLNGRLDTSTEAGKLLDEQVRAVVAGLDEQTRVGIAAGENQQELRERYDASRQALQDQLVQMGLTEDEAWALIEAYGAVPDRVDTTIAADTSGALAQVEEFIRTVNGRRAWLRIETTYPGQTPYVQGTGLPGRADGGPVFGPGTTTSDDILVRLSNSEHVWSAAEVQGAGGHQEVERLRALARKGALPGFAGGGYLEQRFTEVAPSPALAAAPTHLHVYDSSGVLVGTMRAIASAAAAAGRPPAPVALNRDLERDAALGDL